MGQIQGCTLQQDSKHQPAGCNLRFHRLNQPVTHSRLARLLIVALLAKLMLESGIVKFTFFDQDGSNTWRDFTALEYHYWTQPLPHTLSSWIHSLPQWFDEFSLLTMYAVELILPVLLFFPGNIRRFAVLGQVLLQLAILLSGNYGFFNLLTLVLCIPLCDDRMIAFFTREKLKVIESKPFPKVSLSNGCALGLWALFLATGWKHLAQALRGNQPDSAGHYRSEYDAGFFLASRRPCRQLLFDSGADHYC